MDRGYLQLTHRTSGKAFYTAMSGKSDITIISDPLMIVELDRICKNISHVHPHLHPKVILEHIYEDIDNPDCIICMSEPKSIVYAPCGHYVCCIKCTDIIISKMNNKCPMCKSGIIATVSRKMIDDC